MNIRPPAAAWQAPSPGTGKLIALESAELLCIRNGRGTRVRALSGMLWITEGGSSADHMLRPGDEIDIARAGTAIVSAVRPARLVIELIAGNARPDAIEKVRPDGQRTRVVLTTPTRGTLAALAGNIASALVKVIAPIDAIAKKLGTRDVNAPRGMQRRSASATRRVERAVIDQWLMWRE